MLIVGLAILAIAADPQTPRPTDEALLSRVSERIPGAEVLEFHDRPMPEGLPGAKALCGIAMIDGGPQPFFIYTLWREPGWEDGNRWSTTVRAPGSAEATVENNSERRAVNTACPGLVAPLDVDWPTALPRGYGVVRSTDRLNAEGRVIQ
ncbi:hypothetical protein [Brevundimonas sp.]|uniref:hypothetical protein n=1 Tax=Brevundimonas sp. TaxID=1871086 RepID=UPI00262334D7|nr:hypothetical protein [Brevundimonas sp.]